MAQYLEENPHLMLHQDYQNKPLNMDTKIQENKGSFCIDALLSRNDERPMSPDTSRSISPSSTRSRSPPISPGSEDIPATAFVPRPGLLNHIYPNAGGFYGYQGQPQASAFHSLDGTMVQKVHLPRLVGNGERLARRVARESSYTHPGRNINHSAILRFKNLLEEMGYRIEGNAYKSKAS
ncbi:hypothetical protein NQ314_000915 [Rhamnusium bicolor]|uniref:Uncharacterized protein n=1 Tax=Rhamnusium bicolor TaxID=1586634 RepID=A0AAV8ZVP6_9CUCU|nr:hypothetical protein NQ314_000915 [Rhamnusium bicolor]